MISHSANENGLHRANIESLICLKAKAYIEIKERIANGSNEDSKQFRKHKADIFRLTVMLTDNDLFELPQTIKTNMQAFVNDIKNDLPDKQILKEMGLGNVSMEKVYNQLFHSFNLKFDE